MKTRLLWYWSRLFANYWFYPALFVLAGLVLALLATWYDSLGHGAELARALPPLAATPQSAQTMLSIIAGGMIGVAATVFSITIAAVAYASGTYGPRLLTNFLEDRGNQLSLATLIGTFVYSLTVLSSVRSAGDAILPGATASMQQGFVPQLGLLGAYLLAALSVSVIVYLLNHIPSSIRINEVLRDIGQRLLDDVCARFPETERPVDSDPVPLGRAIAARGTGYIQLIDFDEIAELASKTGCRVALAVRTGDFVHPGMTLAWALDDCPQDDLAEGLSGMIALGAERTPEQDPQFLVDELVEIGLRALSPGINDPFTAITALHWLGAATAELGRRDLRNSQGEVDGQRLIHPLPANFSHYVKRGFGGLRSAVATSPIAALVMLDTLRHAAEAIPDPRRRALLQEQGTSLIDQARLSIAGPDMAEVEGRYAEFMQAMRSRTVRPA